MPKRPDRESILTLLRAEQDHAAEQLREWQQIVDACAVALKAFGVHTMAPGEKKTRRKWPTAPKPDLTGVAGYIRKAHAGVSVKDLCEVFGCGGSIAGKNLMARHLKKLKTSNVAHNKGTLRKMLWFWGAAEPG